MITASMQNLRNHYIRAGKFTEEEISYFTGFFYEVKVKRREFILHAGEICKRTVFVEKGCFRVFVQNDDLRESDLYFGFEYWWLSDLESFNNQVPAVHNIQALEDSVVMAVNRADFLRGLEENSVLKEMYTEKVRKGYTAMMDRINSMHLLSAEERYLRMLQQQPQIPQRVPQQYIASYLGIEPQSLSRLRKRIFSRR